MSLDELNHDQEKTTSLEEGITMHNEQPSVASPSRRSFLRKGLAVGGAGAIGAGVLGAGILHTPFAHAQEAGNFRSVHTLGQVGGGSGALIVAWNQALLQILLTPGA